MKKGRREIIKDLKQEPGHRSNVEMPDSIWGRDPIAADYNTVINLISNTVINGRYYISAGTDSTIYVDEVTVST